MDGDSIAWGAWGRCYNSERRVAWGGDEKTVLVQEAEARKQGRHGVARAHGGGKRAGGRGDRSRAGNVESQAGRAGTQLLRRVERADGRVVPVAARLAGLGSSAPSWPSSDVARDGLVVRRRVDRRRLVGGAGPAVLGPAGAWSSPPSTVLRSRRGDWRAGGVPTCRPLGAAPPLTVDRGAGAVGSAPIDESDDEPLKTSSGAGAAEGEGECLRLRSAGATAAGACGAGRVKMGGWTTGGALPSGALLSISTATDAVLGRPSALRRTPSSSIGQVGDDDDEKRDGGADGRAVSPSPP